MFLLLDHKLHSKFVFLVVGIIAVLTIANSWPFCWSASLIFRIRIRSLAYHAKNALRQTQFWTSESMEMTVAVEIAAPHIVVVSPSLPFSSLASSLCFFLSLAPPLFFSVLSPSSPSIETLPLPPLPPPSPPQPHRVSCHRSGAAHRCV